MTDDKKIKLNIKRLTKDAVLPVYAHEGDAGMDLFAAESVEIAPGETGLVGTGLAIELPKGYEAQVRPKSGLALKHSITVLNTPGTIDAGYRAEVRVILINHGKEPYRVECGKKIAQMVVKQVESVSICEVSDLGETKRGSGGFGSTGLG